MLQPFRYEGGYREPSTIDYGGGGQPQEKKEGGNLGGLNDLMSQFSEGGGMNMFSSAGGGEAALAQGGSGSMGPVAELAAAETTAGTSGGSSGIGGWMSSMFGGGGAGAGAGGSSSGMTAAMSNPWTALAAVVVGNELYAHKKGYRDKDPVKYAGDLVSGNVFSDDMEQRWLPKLGIEEGSTANKWLTGLSNPIKPIAGWLKDLF